MQNDVSAAESVLLNSMLNLCFKADKNVFEAVLAEANAIDLSAYSEADLAAFNAAKAAAEAVYNDVNAEQDAADKAVSDLQAAIASLTGAPADTTTNTPTQGDAALTTAGGNAKTGEAAPIALAVASVSLAGAALFISKKRSRQNLPCFLSIRKQRAYRTVRPLLFCCILTALSNQIQVERQAGQMIQQR